MALNFLEEEQDREVVLTMVLLYEQDTTMEDNHVSYFVLFPVERENDEVVAMQRRRRSAYFL